MALRKKASDLVEDEKTNYNSINALKKETEDKIEKLESSRDFRDLQEIEKEKEIIPYLCKADSFERGALKVAPPEILNITKILANIESCMKAGGKGVAIGRNSFHHEDTTGFVKKVYEIVHGKNP